MAATIIDRIKALPSSVSVFAPADSNKIRTNKWNTTQYAFKPMMNLGNISRLFIIRKNQKAAKHIVNTLPNVSNVKAAL